MLSDERIEIEAVASWLGCRCRCAVKEVVEREEIADEPAAFGHGGEFVGGAQDREDVGGGVVGWMGGREWVVKDKCLGRREVRGVGGSIVLEDDDGTGVMVVVTSSKTERKRSWERGEGFDRFAGQ